MNLTLIKATIETQTMIRTIPINTRRTIAAIVLARDPGSLNIG